jgi:hypothetical protein
MTTTKYEYHEHPHVSERAKDGPPSHIRSIAKRYGSPVRKFNSKVGLGITRTVGTMWAAYVFIILSLVSLPAALSSGNVIIIIGWIAQTFLQLVLLPVIIVGQNIQAGASDDRAAATYKDAGAILEEAKQIQLHLAAQDAAATTLMDRIMALETKIAGQAGDTAKA